MRTGRDTAGGEGLGMLSKYSERGHVRFSMLGAPNFFVQKSVRNLFASSCGIER